MLDEGVDVIIGTTGRLIDFAKQGRLDLSAIQVVVLDEADRMYDLGFIKDIRWLFRHMPPCAERMNLLFSATLSYRVRELAFEQMNNPNTLKLNRNSVPVTGSKKSYSIRPTKKNAPSPDTSGRRVAGSLHYFR